MKSELTPVIFRTFEARGDVIALFPFEPSDLYGHHCMSYQHVGQHGGASLDLCSVSTRPSTPDEAAPLKAELELIGYKLKVLKRVPRNARATRWAACDPFKDSRHSELAAVFKAARK